MLMGTTQVGSAVGCLPIGRADQGSCGPPSILNTCSSLKLRTEACGYMSFIETTEVFLQWGHQTPRTRSATYLCHIQQIWHAHQQTSEVPCFHWNSCKNVWTFKSDDNIRALQQCRLQSPTYEKYLATKLNPLELMCSPQIIACRFIPKLGKEKR
jgi:hypothetical protein